MDDLKGIQNDSRTMEAATKCLADQVKSFNFILRTVRIQVMTYISERLAHSLHED